MFFDFYLSQTTSLFRTIKGLSFDPDAIMNSAEESKVVDLKRLGNFIPLDDIDIILIGTSNLEISMSIAYSWANNPEFSKKKFL